MPPQLPLAAAIGPLPSPYRSTPRGAGPAALGRSTDQLTGLNLHSTAPSRSATSSRGAPAAPAGRLSSQDRERQHVRAQSRAALSAPACLPVSANPTAHHLGSHSLDGKRPGYMWPPDSPLPSPPLPQPVDNRQGQAPAPFPHCCCLHRARMHAGTTRDRAGDQPVRRYVEGDRACCFIAHPQPPERYCHCLWWSTHNTQAGQWRGIWADAVCDVRDVWWTRRLADMQHRQQRALIAPWQRCRPVWCNRGGYLCCPSGSGSPSCSSSSPCSSISCSCCCRCGKPDGIACGRSRRRRCTCWWHSSSARPTQAPRCGAGGGAAFSHCGETLP